MRKTKSRFLLALAAALPLAAAAQEVKRLADGVIVRPADAGAADVRLQLVDPSILRVSADPDGDFQRSPSLMRAPVAGPAPSFTLERGAGAVRLQADGIAAEVALADGSVRFFDAQGRPLLEESPGGRGFEPVEFEGRPYYSIRQRFRSPEDEAFYGTGLHQQGWMNLKGRDVELLQHNIDKAIPYLLSSRNYASCGTTTPSPAMATRAACARCRKACRCTTRRAGRAR